MSENTSHTRIIVSDEKDRLNNRFVDLPADYADRLPPEWSEHDDLAIENSEFTITGHIDESGAWVSLLLKESDEPLLEEFASYDGPDGSTRAAVRNTMYQMAWELHQFVGSPEDIKRIVFSEYESSETELADDPIRKELPEEPLNGTHVQALEDLGYGPVLPTAILPPADDPSSIHPAEDQDDVYSFLAIDEQPREIAFNFLAAMNPKPEAVEHAWRLVWEGTSRNGRTVEEVWDEYGSPLAHRSDDSETKERFLDLFDVPTSLEEARELRERLKE